MELLEITNSHAHFTQDVDEEKCANLRAHPLMLLS